MNQQIIVFGNSILSLISPHYSHVINKSQNFFLSVYGIMRSRNVLEEEVDDAWKIRSQVKPMKTIYFLFALQLNFFHHEFFFLFTIPSAKNFNS